MLDWKIIASVLAGFILFTAGLTHGFGDFLNDAKDYVGRITGRFISSIFPTHEGSMPVHAELLMNGYTLSSTMKVDGISLEYSNSATVTLSDKVVDTTGLGNVSMELRNFDGEFSINSSSTSFNGRISRIGVNGVRIYSGEPYPVESDGVKADRVLLRGIENIGISGDEFSGEVSVDGVRFTISQNPLEIMGFSGDIKIENGRMVLNGRAVKLTVKGKEYTAILS